MRCLVWLRFQAAFCLLSNFLIIGRIARISKQRRFQSKRQCFRMDTNNK